MQKEKNLSLKSIQTSLTKLNKVLEEVRQQGFVVEGFETLVEGLEKRTSC